MIADSILTQGYSLNGMVDKDEEKLDEEINEGELNLHKMKEGENRKIREEKMMKEKEQKKVEQGGQELPHMDITALKTVQALISTLINKPQ